MITLIITISKPRPPHAKATVIMQLKMWFLFVFIYVETDHQIDGADGLCAK